MALSFDDIVQAFIAQESGGNPNAVSRKGAVGMMQIMPDTARQYGVDPSRLKDPWINEMLGRKLLAKYMNQYGGDISKVATAYDAGPGRVGQSQLPKETQGYISSIWNRLGNMVEGTAYGAELPPRLKGAKEVPDPWATPSIPAGAKEVSDPWAATPEQGYEKGVSKLPRALQYVTPSTMGEAGFMGGSLVMPVLAGLGLAPETGGASLALGLPLLGAAIGGGLEDPKHRLAGAAYETGKGVLQEAAGGVLSKGLELGTRFAEKTGMLERTANRIWQGIGGLFSKLPLAPGSTAQDLRTIVGRGELKEAAGARLGQFRDTLTNQIPEYKPATKPQLVPASSGVAPHYTPGTPASGVKFTLPDYAITKDGDPVRITNDFSIGQAIDHVRKLQAESFTPSGSPKGADISWLRREVGHDARVALRNQLNHQQPGLGDAYSAISGDYGVANNLEEVFQGVYRPDGQIDQAKLLRKIDKYMPDILRLKGQDRANLFAHAISPTGKEATAEMNPLARMHAGESGIRSIFHLPIPYKPETRQLLTQPFRGITDPRMRALLGAGVGRGLEGMSQEPDNAP